MVVVVSIWEKLGEPVLEEDEASGVEMYEVSMVGGM